MKTRPLQPTSLRSIVCSLTLLTVAGFVGFQLIYSTFAEYDDEGYVMLSIDQFIEGKPLYEATYTQYGPSFFFIQRWLHQAMGWEVSHDVARMRTLMLWLLTAGLSAWLVAGTQRPNQTAHVSRTWRGALAALSFLLAFFHLEKLCLEPGHPQQWCAVLGAAILLLVGGAAWRRGAERHVLLAFSGALTGVLVTTKVNIGGLAGLAVVLSLLSCIDGRPARVLFGVLAAACGLLPWMLMMPSLGQANAWTLPLLCSVGCWSLALAAPQSGQHSGSEQKTTWSDVIVYGLASAVCATTFVVLARLDGTSWAGIYHGMIGQHQEFTTVFFHASPIGAAVIVSSAVSLVMLALFKRQANEPREKGLVFCGQRFVHGVAMAVSLAGLAAFVAAATLTATVPVVHGLVPRGMTAMAATWLGPLVWILLFGAPTDTDIRSGKPLQVRSSERVLLGFAATLWPIASYPTPGTQFDVSMLPLLLAVLIGASDWLLSAARVDAEDIAESKSDRQATNSAPGAREILGVPSQRVLAAALGVALAALLIRGAIFTQRRSQNVSIDLPGARLLRIQPEAAERQQWIASQLQDCDTFVFRQHGLNRFYFWTQRDPPTGLNATFWPFLLDDDEQRRIVNALQQHRLVGLVDLDYDADLPEGPLSEYLDSHFQTTAKRDGIRIRMRTNPIEPLSLAGGPARN